MNVGSIAFIATKVKRKIDKKKKFNFIHLFSTGYLEYLFNKKSAGEHRDVPQHMCIVKTKENTTLCGPG